MGENKKNATLETIAYFRVEMVLTWRIDQLKKQRMLQTKFVNQRNLKNSRIQQLNMENARPEVLSNSGRYLLVGPEIQRYHGKINSMLTKSTQNQN